MGTKLANYPNSRGTGSYAIIRGGDGVVYCECMGWKMNKDCKHLRAFLGKCATSTPGPTAPKGLAKRAASKAKTDSNPELAKAVEQAVAELKG